MPPRGRPPGRTPDGDARREALYDTALSLFSTVGYEATTLRRLAREAGVSPGLLYKYFPSKDAVVLELYDRLSATYAERSSALPTGGWAARAVAATRASVRTLEPHRAVLRAILGVLVGDPERGLFSSTTRFSRQRVESVFRAAISQASDAPSQALVPALARVAYVAHLGVVLWFLLDRSAEQRTTWALLDLLERGAPVARTILWIPGSQRTLGHLAGLISEGLFGEPRQDAASAGVDSGLAGAGGRGDGTR